MLRLGTFLWFAASVSASAVTPATCLTRLGALHAFLRSEFEFADVLMSLGDMGHDEIVGADGMSTPSYDDYFASILPEGSFAELLRLRGPNRRHVLELAGSGVFLKTDEVDSITGVRLTVKTFKDTPLDPEGKRGQVAGDLYRLATARAVAADRGERGIGHYDLIVIRPIGGLVGPTTDSDAALEAYGIVMLATLNRYAAGLASDGEVFSQLNRAFSQSALFNRWVERLRERNYVVTQGQTRYSRTPVIRLRRVPGTPNQFPGLD